MTPPIKRRKICFYNVIGAKNGTAPTFQDVDTVGVNIMSNSCCPTFARALENETDNESYEALIYIQDDGTFGIGCESLPSMSYCPWCGTKLL